MEQQLISWIKQRVNELCEERRRASVLLGIGDDGAILNESECKRVFASDTIVEGVHFESAKDSLELIGRKAIAVNLSDIAAMGAIGESALVSLVLPESWPIESAKQVLNGLINMATAYDVSIIGGDTVRHAGGLVISVSVTGLLLPAFKNPAGWRMDGAKEGDCIVVTGPLGGSLAGHHLRFEPRLHLAKAIQERVNVNAATDISDSLSIDLTHVLQQSKVGAELQEDQIPVNNASRVRSPDTSRTPLQHALYDGEDFELLLSMTEQTLTQLVNDKSFQFQLHSIGRIVSEHPGKIISSQSGREIRPIGYEH